MIGKYTKSDTLYFPFNQSCGLILQILHIGATIVVTTSSFLAHEAERLTIADISFDGMTLTTVENLMYDHTSFTYDIDGKKIVMAAEVGLLSRRIKIVGAPSNGKFI